MRLRNILYCLLFLASATGLVSCSHDNPPLDELAGTRWEGTNIAKGVLIDLQAAPKGTYDITMTYYLDPREYDIRGAKVDTTGNRKFSIKGVYTPAESTTDKGEIMYGYRWNFSGTEPDGTKHSGSLEYDNKRMYLHLDKLHYPMTQVL